MARSIFGGRAEDLVVTQDAGNGNALVIAPSTTVQLYDAPGGTLQNNFLLWDGAAYTVPATSIVSSASGTLPAFAGPDGLTALYLPDGRVLLPRTSGGGPSSWSEVAALTGFPAAFPNSHATAAPGSVFFASGTSTAPRPSSRDDIIFLWYTSDGLFPVNSLGEDIWLNGVESL